MNSFMTVDSYGNKCWKDARGRYHRENGPAVIWNSDTGRKDWFVNGKRHRKDGPAIEWADGTKFWYMNDQLHRNNGPACEYSNGGRYWYKRDKLHREDGPAVQDYNGLKEWWINGEKLTEKEFNNWRMLNKPLTYIDMTVRVKRNFSNNKDLWV